MHVIVSTPYMSLCPASYISLHIVQPSYVCLHRKTITWTSLYTSFIQKIIMSVSLESELPYLDDDFNNLATAWSTYLNLHLRDRWPSSILPLDNRCQTVIVVTICRFWQRRLCGRWQIGKRPQHDRTLKLWAPGGGLDGWYRNRRCTLLIHEDTELRCVLDAVVDAFEAVSSPTRMDIMCAEFQDWNNSVIRIFEYVSESLSK